MPKYARKVGRIFLMEWSRIVQYRTDAILWTLASVAIPLISLAIWYTVAKSSGRGPAPIDVFTYYILIMIIKLMAEAWAGPFLAQEILNGDIAKDLVRPLAVVWKYIANDLLEKSFKLLVPLPLFLLALALFPARFSPAIYQAKHVYLFAASLLLAIVLGFAAEIVIGSLAFWFEDVYQIRRYKVMLEEAASGVMIPLAFMPPIAQQLLSWLPFRYIFSAPAEIILGTTLNRSALGVLGIQLAWVVGLLLLARVLWQQGLRRYAVPGR